MALFLFFLLSSWATLSSYTYIIDGYTNRLSVLPGDSLYLYLNASATDKHYKLSLYDLSGQVVKRIEASVSPQLNLNPLPYENGFGYSVSVKVLTPNLPSGMYLWENKIPFIIKRKNPKIVVAYPSNTENAYNNAGGKSLYGFNSTENKGATKVSFMRPHGIEMYSEAFLRWILKEQIPDVSYITDMDMDNYESIKAAQILVIPGHSEYWTLPARKNFDKFVASGKDVMILSGNTMWWQVRYSNDHKDLICYRRAEDDLTSLVKQKTILWNDKSLEYPILKSIGADFSIGGYGDKLDNGWDGYKITSNSPFLSEAGLKKGDTLKLKTREGDGAPLLVSQNLTPRINEVELGFYKIEMVGFDWVMSSKGEGAMTWIIFKPAKNAGTVINVASTNWCSENGIGTNPKIQVVTKVMIKRLLNKESLFSDGKDVSM